MVTPLMLILIFHRLVLINEIAKNVDAQWYSSIFLHWVPGGKISMGPIWDFDLGFAT